MNSLEIGIGILYTLFFLSIGFILKKKLSSPMTEKYFMLGLGLKIIGGLSVGLIYYFYYKGGDTVTYYTYGAQHIWRAFVQSPDIAFQMIFGENKTTPLNYPFASQIWVFNDDASYFCVRFAGLFNLFAFNTYSGTVIIFAFLSFLCIWKIYQLAVDLYTDMHLQFAIGFLFMPSVFFWGSGILKDTITFAFLCLMIHSVFSIYYYRRNVLINILIILISAYFIAQIKIYILIALIPAIAYLFLLGPIKKIQNPIIKGVITPIVLVISIVLGFVSIQKVGEFNSKYSLDTMSKTAESTARWIHHVSVTDGGSSYSLGDYDFSALGTAKKTIPAIWVTLFRPHPWEARNPIMVLSALEALFFIWLFYTGYIQKFKLNSKARTSSVMITMCLIFSLIFAWAVGLTTYNFGSLVRYKIPMMPFFVIAMSLMKRNKKILASNR